MEIRKMTATFGCLTNETLTLSPGLNVITLPNESGKSTWCAFLRAMLYGFPPRARGLQSDKNRYLPWSGAAMEGVMELMDGERAITLTRRTARANSPMGSFSAVYTSTASPVEGLDGGSCGETLLGVSREVFQRSAFIRQNGMVIDQDAELERRISALITTGEEDTSYSESYEALKKQLNRRRHNKTGQLPALESRLQELERQIAAGEALEDELAEQTALAERLRREETALQAELTAIDRAEKAARRQARADAGAALAQAQRDEQALSDALIRDAIPENETIARLRGAIVNLETSRKSETSQRARRDEAALALVDAEKAVSASPFAGESPESARVKAAPVPYRPTLAEWIVAAAVALVLFAGVSVLLRSLSALAFLPGGVCACVWMLLFGTMRRHTYLNREKQARYKRFGTEDDAAVAAEAERYAQLLSQRDTCKEALSEENARLDALHATVSANEQAILLEIRRFAPTAFDVAEADALLRQCAQRRRALADAKTRTQQALLRFELLPQETEESEPAPAAAVTPKRSREEAQAQQKAVLSRLAAAQSACDRLAGQKHATGSLELLRAQRQQTQAEIAALEKEYRAIAMAMEALSTANTTLQNRFSPALGAEAARIFRRITGGRYEEVLLNREMNASAREAASPVAREAELLSRGTVDELYLAIRLAICQLVLPADKAAPIILDDALVNFDDQRAQNALNYLVEAAKDRQILLFTCQSRESRLLQSAANYIGKE